MRRLPPQLPLGRPQPQILETPAVWNNTASANRRLAELKALAASMPNHAILIHTRALQEAGQRNHRDRRLQAVREQADAQDLSQEGVLYMLAAVEATAQQTIKLTRAGNA